MGLTGELNPAVTFYTTLNSPVLTGHTNGEFNPFDFNAIESELDDAKISTVKGETFDSLDARFEDIEGDTKALELTKADKTTTYTKAEVDATVAVKRSNITATDYTVDTPVWTNQPTIYGGGSLDLSFVGWNTNYYFVTFKNTDGTALESGQFKLCTSFGGYATAINQVFVLAGYATGNSGTLGENSVVDFKTIGALWSMRSASIREIDLPIINTTAKQIKIVFTSKICRSVVSPSTGYMYIKVNPFNTDSSICVGPIGIYSGRNGLLCTPSFTGTLEKFSWYQGVFLVNRNSDSLIIPFNNCLLQSGSRTLSKSATRTTVSAVGILKDANEITNFLTVNLTGVTILYTGWAYGILNGSTYTVEEVL